MQNKKILTTVLVSLTIMLAFWRHTTVVTAMPAAQADSRLVIKRGELTVMVQDTDTAVQTALDLGNRHNSYILSQRVWDGDSGYRYANITFGVPAAEFERLAQALKSLGTLVDENATGEDVTDATVDLESRLGNLYANQERMRSFLEETTNITETLDVHHELLQVENEIGDLQGQVNYLKERAAAATITLHLEPVIATPTPTPTATPTPLPTPAGWNPGNTAQRATVRLQNTAQNTADFTIYYVIACGPWLFLFGLISYPAWRVYRWRQRKLTPSTAPETNDASDSEADTS